MKLSKNAQKWEKTGLLEGLNDVEKEQLMNCFEDLCVLLIKESPTPITPYQEFINVTIIPICRRVFEGISDKTKMPSVDFLLSDYKKHIVENKLFPLAGIDGHEKLGNEADICLEYSKEVTKRMI